MSLGTSVVEAVSDTVGGGMFVAKAMDEMDCCDNARGGFDVCPGAREEKETKQSEGKTPAKAAQLIDINSATPEELKAIPGIEDAYSAMIIRGGPYQRKDELVQKEILPQGVYEGQEGFCPLLRASRDPQAPCRPAASDSIAKREKGCMSHSWDSLMKRD